MIKLICGDCIDVLKDIDTSSIDLVLTDPPFTDYHTDIYKQTPIDFLKEFPCRQLVFWSAKVEFPLDYTAIHIWDKRVGVASEYERIFERNGQKNYKLFSAYLIHNEVASDYNKGEPFTGHPSQKPRKLILKMLKWFTKEGDLVFDPFMGTGVVGECCKYLGRDYIGVEIEKKWYDIAKERIDKVVSVDKWL